ncbi:hypothetical protein RHSIM_Rhsim03G0211800 [Rhododendron simsii]|uniref:Uncharacterized protein n=1 Tax=Rhododendron simsii TaxID=118357 RepID=A0A834HGI4_RHOSS|nr:hypothetical protein RHSIM_Rhsim03G0211800 [Rhododendron simsii]
MAAVVRCSSQLRRLTPPLSTPAHLPPPNFRFRLGNMGSIPLKVKKLISSVENAAKEEFEAYLALLGRHAMPMGVDDVKTSISEGNFVGPTQLDDDSSPGHLLAHQVMVLGRFPAFALFVVNALMFGTPLEALAETFEADKSIFNMPLLLFAAFMGATVGDLRRQAKIKSLAPTLRNAPAVGKVPENEVIADPRKHELISRLKSGDDFLTNQDPDKAFVEFEAALKLAHNLSDRTNMKKAGAGLGASLQMQGLFHEAIKCYFAVPASSKREGKVRSKQEGKVPSKRKWEGKDSGDSEAYRAIAECYTELGEVDMAKAFYEKYSNSL